MTEEAGDIAHVLAAAAQGSQEAIGRLYSLLYPELRKMAHARVREANNALSLNTTSLVHESYLRLVQRDGVDAVDRKHFLAYAAHVMRSVVVDHVRYLRAQRRGGEQVHLSFNTTLQEGTASPADEILMLHELLDQLAEVSPRLVSIVEMRYFAALEVDEIAAALDVSTRTVNRDFDKIRLLLIDAQS